MVPSLRLDRARPDVAELADMLARFWLPDETVLYIGKAGTSLRSRVGQLYRHVLGEPKPHCGGSWMKATSVLTTCTVFWACTKTPEDDETVLLREFMARVSDDSRRSLQDPELPLPFANLEFRFDGTKLLKKHGLSAWKR